MKLAKLKARLPRAASMAPRPKRPAPTTLQRPKTVLKAERPPNPALTRVQVQPQAEAQARTTAPIDGLGIVHYAALAVPALLATLLAGAHGAMDRPVPNTGGATNLYAVTLASGIVALAGMAFAASRNRWQAMLGVAAGLPLAFWLVNLARSFGGYYCGQPDLWPGAGTDYPCNRDALIGGELVALVLVPAAGAAIVAALLHGRNPRDGQATALGTASALTAAFTGAAAMLLGKVSGDADEAARANQLIHHTPGLEAVAALVALLAAVAVLRRRR